MHLLWLQYDSQYFDQHIVEDGGKILLVGYFNMLN